MAAALASIVILTASPAAAQDDPEVIRAEVVTVEPADESAAIVVNDRRYRGSVRIRGHSGGLAVVEEVALDDYLAGIQEVPLSWEPAALEAQVIAARTYLAWTLARGRTASGRTYDYDICATDACQVYAGIEPVLTDGGDKWRAAVAATDSQILLHDGRPAQAYYSSTSGGRTRTVSDVWPDIDLPYLRGVDSPNEDSPFTEWMWRLPHRHMTDLLATAGLIEGELVRVTSNVREDGEGPWTITFHSSERERTIDTWSLRGVLNRLGPAVQSTHLPAFRPDGPRYPQTILSPSFTMTTTRLPVLVPGKPPIITIHQVDGRGWGHLIGMSQYGAQAMAEEGATAAEILAHYYGGLEPREAPEFVPDTVEVSLVVGAPEFALEVTGPVDVTVDGNEVGAEELGSWAMTADQGGIALTTPTGLGLPPALRPRDVQFLRGWMILRVEVTAASEVSWEVTRDGLPVSSRAPTRMDAGFFRLVVPPGPDVEVALQASNAHGSDEVRLVGGSARQVGR